MLTEKNNPELSNLFKTINIIYFSMIITTISFFMLVLIVNQSKEIVPNNELDLVFTLVIPLFGLLMMFASRIIYSQLVSKNSSNKNLQQKISIYKSSKIIVWALVESASLLSLVAAMLSPNYLYLVVFIFLLGYFYLLRPSKESFVKDLRLTSEEMDLILRKEL